MSLNLDLSLSWLLNLIFNLNLLYLCCCEEKIESGSPVFTL